MKIVIAGGTGLIGRRLIAQLVNRGNVVTVLTRNDSTNTLHPSVRNIRWNVNPSGDWCSEITSADAVINLAGESIAAGRWTANRKRRILQSRVQSTQVIVSAIKQSRHKPAVFINASAVGYYGNVPEGEVTEETVHGSGFLADVCEQWEREAFKV
ncbi:MAG TPA: NAD-dependent epimerase/dehydratase family protein, partial [Bacteroidota bacterium]|nr:NAD-dependent epimerase/dehydratase family protein [Bacteroidota bacterium]